MKFEKAHGTPAFLSELDYTDKSWDKPWNQHRGQVTSIERMPSYVLESNSEVIPLPRGNALNIEAIQFEDPLTSRSLSFEDYLNRRIFSDALLIAKNGEVVYENYFNGMAEQDQHLCHSCTKTLTTMQIGLAVEEGLLDTSKFVHHYLEEMREVPAWQEVTVQNLLDMSTGVASDEHYENPNSMYYDYANAVGYWGQVDSEYSGAYDFVLRRLTETECAPGARFNYASYNTNLLPLILERIYGEPAASLYERNLFAKIGAEHDAVLNCDPQGLPIVEGHLNLTLRDFYRWGSLLHNGGVNLAGDRVIPEGWVIETLSSSKARRAAFLASDYAEAFPNAEYHNQVWLLDPSKGISAMLGIYGQFFYSDRSQDLVIAGFSSYPDLAPALMTASMLELWSVITTSLAE